MRKLVSSAVIGLAGTIKKVEVKVGGTESATPTANAEQLEMSSSSLPSASHAGEY